MIEEISMVRDALNAQEFDAVPSTNVSPNSDGIGSILSVVIFAGISILLFVAIQHELLKNEND